MTPYRKTVTAESRGGLITFHQQEFLKGADGSLIHITDGVQRASVPPEGWERYCEEWPDCRGVVAYLRSGKKTLTAKKGKK